MIRGVTTLVTGMEAAMARQEIVAKNLANFLTPGYKQEVASMTSRMAGVDRADTQTRTVLTSLGEPLPSLGDIAAEVAFDRVWVDLSQGAPQQTDRPLDIALVGDGFLRVRTPNGEYYSRGGALQLDATRKLVTAEGYSVLGPEGEVILDDGEPTFSEDGRVYLDGQAANQLSVVEFGAGTLMAKVGEGLYTPDDPATPVPTVAVATNVKQGYLEGSNVDETRAMTEMVWLLRSYQASQRMLQAQDDLLGKVINEVGRI